MNCVILVGRLTKAPEIRTLEDGTQVGSFTVAIDRGKGKSGADLGADFPRVQVWGKTAENCERYLDKGQMVAVQGRIRTGSYTSREGKTVYTTDVKADRVEFIDHGNKIEQGRNLPHVDHISEPRQTHDFDEQVPMGGFSPLGDEDIPF